MEAQCHSENADDFGTIARFYIAGDKTLYPLLFFIEIPIHNIEYMYPLFGHGIFHQ
jgi:hypothetical protein